MSKFDKKRVIENLKTSIENETPDVWGKIKDAEKCRFDVEFKPQKPKRPIVRWAAAAAVIFIIGFTAIEINFNNLSGNRLKSNSTGNAAATVPGAPSIDSARAPVPAMSTAPMTPYQPFVRDAKTDEAAKAMNINIAEPSWLPDGFKQTASQLFYQDDSYSNPYLYQMQFVNASGVVLTVNVQKYVTDKVKSGASQGSDVNAVPPAVPVIPVAPPVPATTVVPGNPVAPPAPATTVVPVVPVAPPVSAVPVAPPPTPPVQSEPQYPPVDNNGSPSSSGLTAIAPQAESAPVTGNVSTSTVSAGISVSIEFVKITVNGTDVNMNISDDLNAVSAFWIYDGSTYNISTSGISKDDMTKIIDSMIK